MATLASLLSVSPELEAFCGKCHPQLLAIGDVVEIARSSVRKAWSSENIDLKVGSEEEFPIDSAAAALAAEFEELAGQGWEQKYRVALLKPDKTQNLLVTLVPITYEMANGFHRALQARANGQNRGAIQLLRAQWLKRLAKPGRYTLPGIAVVHAIVLTADRKILVAQRSPNTNYAPLHWSASFEEQITTKDVERGSAVFGSAAARGFAEEFFAGSQLPLSQLPVLSVFLDVSILNIGFCVEVQVPWSFDEIVANWEKRPRDHWEAINLSFIPMSLEPIGRLLRGEVSGVGLGDAPMLHETSRYRLLVLALRHFAYDDLIRVLM